MKISIYLLLSIMGFSIFAAGQPAPLKTGDEFPEITLQNQDGELVNLSSYKGKWLILYFYPKDNTPGCRKEALAFTRLKNDYSTSNAVVFGVNPASSASHKKFVNKYKLKIELLVDNKKKLMKLFGVKSFFGFCSRDTVLINPAGQVEKIYRGVSPEGSPGDILAYVRSHQFP